MANILIFEDDAELIYEHILPAIEDTPHEIVGCADSLLKAQLYIGKLLSNEIEVDILLLDGNLDRRNRPKEFRYTFPLDGSEVVKKTLFGKGKPPQPRELVIQNQETGFGSDARMIRKILDICNIQLPIIGISGEPMEKSGVEVDIDLGKWGIWQKQLLPAIDSLDRSVGK